MADNFDFTPGTGATGAADDVSGVLYQRVKLDAGGDGVAVPVVAGTQLAAASLPVALSSDGTFATLSGALTEAAPATDIASSGLNGRLQRIAQRITSLIASTLGFSVNSGNKDATTMRVVIATDQPSLNNPIPVSDNSGSITVDGTVSLTDISAGEYETVAASQTAQVMGPTGGSGDYIAGVLVVPATTSPGNVLLLDNATSITIFAGGANSVSNLIPFFIPLGIKSVSGAWKITTGANVSCIASGNFT